jgi:hypothetical protein
MPWNYLQQFCLFYKKSVKVMHGGTKILVNHPVGMSEFNKMVVTLTLAAFLRPMQYSNCKMGFFIIQILNTDIPTKTFIGRCQNIF